MVNLSKPTIYSKETIDQIPWDQTSNDRSQQEILKAFVTLGPQHYIKNVHATVKALHVGNKVLPITICEAPNLSSYVCSPYTHYITYGQEEVKTLSNRPLSLFLGGFLRLFGLALNFCNIDKNVFVNNWLLPTNLHPDLTVEEIRAINETLISEYPDHAILFRSINKNHPKDLFENLQEAGYAFVMSREVYFTDTKENESFKSRMFKSDQKILNCSEYKIVADVEELKKIVPRIKDLYYSLNIQKYSKCNPQYSEDFIKLALESGWMTFKTFEKDGSADGVLGYFSQGDIMTSPYFGYDTSLPSDLGIYRQIATLLLLDAREKQSLLHQSSGAGHYKKLRRAKSFPEYTAVYHHHLSFKRRQCWKGLRVLLDKFGTKVMDEIE